VDLSAYNKELKSIISMGVMTELQPGTARYAEALTSEATTLCRVLLDKKRDGTLKARITSSPEHGAGNLRPHRAGCLPVPCRFARSGQLSHRTPSVF
jgi:hypothetical protein